MSKDWVDLTFFPFSFEWLCRLHFHFWNPRKLCGFISQALLPPLSHEIIDAWFLGLGHHSLCTLGYIFGPIRWTHFLAQWLNNLGLGLCMLTVVIIDCSSRTDFARGLEGFHIGWAVLNFSIPQGGLCSEYWVS